MDKQRIGQYQLLQKIDLGGMAEIFRARRVGPHGFEKIVAIKIILPHLSSDREFVAMFSSEAKVTAQLQHPNIVQIYDFGRDDDTYFIAMEYIHGLNLNDLILILEESDLELSLDHINYIIKHVCAALEYAHCLTDLRGKPLEIVHRDINPKNVMLSFSGEIKLMDFGIALAASRCFQTLADGMIKGKLAYLSPEQVRSHELDRRADLFSLGIVYYELITGKRPFVSNTEFGVLSKIEREIPVPPIELVPTLPVEINDIIMKCLSKDRETRFQSAQEIRYAVEQFERRSGLKSTQSKFVLFLEAVLGKEVVHSPLITDELQSDDDTPSGLSSDDLSEEVNQAAPVNRNEFPDDLSTEAVPSIDVLTSQAETLIDALPEVETEDNLDLPDTSFNASTDMSMHPELDTELDKPHLLEKLRFPMIVLFILLASSGITYLFLGLDGVLRIAGMDANEYTAHMVISVEPEDAKIELDFMPTETNPADLDLVWQLGSNHVVKLTHPSHQSVTLMLKTPEDKSSNIKLDKTHPGVILDNSSSGYHLSVKMIPEYREVSIRSTPPGVQIRINEVDTGKTTPMKFLFSTEKDSIIHAKKSGYESTETIYRPDPFSASNHVELNLKKIKKPTPVPVPKGKVTVKSPYPVTVYSGNRRLFKNITQKSFYLPIGTRTLRIANRAFLLNVEKTVKVTSNGNQIIQIEPTGTMIVDADKSGCVVYIGDMELGMAPGSFELAPGLYNVIFKWDDCPDVVSKWVKINSKQNKRVPKVQGCR
jgi:serine/threonine protein kinase